MNGTKLLNFRPAAFAAVFLCLGIFSAIAFSFYQLPVWWLSFVLPFFALFYRKKQKRALIALALLLAVYWVGFGWTFSKIHAFRSAGEYFGEEYHVTATVVDESETEYGIKLLLSEITVDGKGEQGCLIAYLPTSFSENVSQGDRLLLKGALKTEQSVFDTQTPNLTKLGNDVRYVLNASSCTVIEKSFSLFVFLRDRLETVVYAGMDETSAAVTMAVLTGNDDGMESGLLENMRRGGIAHVFAVSGLHIGALFGFVVWLIGKTFLRNLSKGTRFAIVAFVLLLYGGVCGFSASVTRAITICLCFYGAKLIGLGSDSLEALGLAALITLCIRPFSLFQAGFQLSFAACLGIILLSRPIERLCYKLVGDRRAKLPLVERDRHPLSVGERVKKACISFLSVSVSAQIATTPLSLSIFGCTSCLALFLNFLFVPLISATFSALLAFVCIAALLPVAWSGVILYAPSVAWSALLLLFQTIDFSSYCIEGIIVPIGGLICYYLALSFVSDKWNVAKTVRFMSALACFVLAFCCVFIVNML